MLTPVTFKVLKQSKLERAAQPGITIYGFIGHTYGVVSLDNKVKGVKHGAFTLKPDGDYPFFTMPMTDVEELE